MDVQVVISHAPLALRVNCGCTLGLCLNLKPGNASKVIIYLEDYTSPETKNSSFSSQSISPPRFQSQSIFLYHLGLY